MNCIKYYYRNAWKKDQDGNRSWLWGERFIIIFFLWLKIYTLVRNISQAGLFVSPLTYILNYLIYQKMRRNNPLYFESPLSINVIFIYMTIIQRHKYESRLISPQENNSTFHCVIVSGDNNILYPTLYHGDKNKKIQKTTNQIGWGSKFTKIKHFFYWKK